MRLRTSAPGVLDFLKRKGRPMGQLNRYIKGNPALDDVDHALGRPYRPNDTYRDHYATDCPDQIAKMRASDWWNEGVTRGGMTFFHVSIEGRKALAQELRDHTKYGRLYEVSRPGEWSGGLVMATSRSAAKYAAYVEADVDWPFIEYCRGLSVRVAA